MPWHVAKSGQCPDSKPWSVIRDADGTVEGCHDSRESAERQMAALYSAEDRSWFRITNRGELLPATGVWLYDEIGSFGITAGDFVKSLGEITDEQIEMHINSPGGEVFDGMAIYNAIRNHPAHVTVIIDGLAASAASFVAMAGDVVNAEPNATLMIHEAHGIAAGNSLDLRKLAGVLDGCSDQIAGIYAEKAGGRPEDWRSRMKAETWFTASEAKRAGLVDQVIRPTRAVVGVPRNTVAWDLSFFRYPGRSAAPDPFAPADSVEPPRTVPEVPRVVDMSCPAHDTATAEGTWDADMHKARMPSPMPVAAAKRMFAYIDGSRVEDGMMPKGAGKLPHHEVSTDGTPGAANLSGVRAALSRLGQDATEIPASDVAAVRAHLRAHLGNQAEDAAEVTPVAEVSAEPVVFDPALFRAAMARAARVDFDPAAFRESMSAAASTAAAQPQAPAASVYLGPDLPTPAPPAKPDPWDGFRTAMAAAAVNAAAPTQPARPAVDLGPALPEPPPPPRSDPWDGFRAAMSGAASDAAAPADPATPAHDLGPPVPPKPPPEPERRSHTGELIRAAVSLAATDAAVPPQPNTQNPATGPGFPLDAQRAFRAAIREAVSE